MNSNKTTSQIGVVVLILPFIFPSPTLAMRVQGVDGRSRAGLEERLLRGNLNQSPLSPAAVSSPTIGLEEETGYDPLMVENRIGAFVGQYVPLTVEITHPRELNKDDSLYVTDIVATIQHPQKEGSIEIRLSRDGRVWNVEHILRGNPRYVLEVQDPGNDLHMLTDSVVDANEVIPMLERLLAKPEMAQAMENFSSAGLEEPEQTLGVNEAFQWIQTLAGHHPFAYIEFIIPEEGNKPSKSGQVASWYAVHNPEVAKEDLRMLAGALPTGNKVRILREDDKHYVFYSLSGPPLWTSGRLSSSEHSWRIPKEGTVVNWSNRSDAPSGVKIASRSGNKGRYLSVYPSTGLRSGEIFLYEEGNPRKVIQSWAFSASQLEKGFVFNWEDIRVKLETDPYRMDGVLIRPAGKVPVYISDDTEKIPSSAGLEEGYPKVKVWKNKVGLVFVTTTPKTSNGRVAAALGDIATIETRVEVRNYSYAAYTHPKLFDTATDWDMAIQRHQTVMRIVKAARAQIASSPAVFLSSIESIFAGMEESQVTGPKLVYDRYGIPQLMWNMSVGKQLPSAAELPASVRVITPEGLLPQGVIDRFQSDDFKSRFWMVDVVASDISEQGLKAKVSEWEGKGPVFVIVDTRLENAVRELTAYGKITAVVLHHEDPRIQSPNWLLALLLDILQKRELNGHFFELAPATQAGMEEREALLRQL